MKFRNQQVVRTVPENWYGTVVGDNDQPLIIDGEYSIILFPEFVTENNGKILISVPVDRIQNQYD